MISKSLAVGLCLGLASAANAVTVAVDTFTVPQGPISDLAVDATPVTNTLGIAPFRTLSSDLIASADPVSNSVEVVAGVLDIVNGTGEDSQVIVTVPIGVNTLPLNALNVNFLLEVVASDGNPTQIQLFIDAMQLGATAFVPGNTMNTPFLFSLTAPEIAAVQGGGNLRLVLDGEPGWDATFDSLGFNFDEPRTEVPEPASMGLAILGLAALGVRRRRMA